MDARSLRTRSRLARLAVALGVVVLALASGASVARAAGATVVVRLHSCPTSLDASLAPLADLTADCQDHPSGVAFTLTAADGSSQGGSTAADGSVSWQAVPTGSVTVAQQAPAGVNVMRVFCDQRAADGSDLGTAELPVESGAITGKLADNATEMDCDWFDATGTGQIAIAPVTSQPQPTAAAVPQPPARPSISFNVFICPPGYDVTAKGADPTHDCNQQVVGTAFSSLGVDTNVKTTHRTDADGSVSFGNLHAGGHLITQTYPDGVDSAFVFNCTSSLRDPNNEPFSPFAPIDQSGSLLVTVDAGEQFACDWYDVPTAESAAGNATPAGSGEVTLTITALYCPGQTAPDPSQCRPAPSGLAFGLDPVSGGDMLTAITNKSGVASIQIPAGSYKLSEIEGSFCAATSDDLASDNTLTVAGDHDVEITIQNCGH